MARKSFTLRRGTPEGGSYLQYYPTTNSASAASASATYLRADEIQFAPESSLRSGVSFFEGYCDDYNTVKLRWDVGLEEPGVLPTPYDLHIVYSPIGHPETVIEGQLLINTRSERSLVHKVYDYQWAYYTMFVRYLSDSDDEYYEPVAKLSVLLPNNYGTAEDMYSRIPLWYKGLDETQGNESLKKFLRVFGWDVDRIRTILDYKISMKDPQVAEVETLNNIAGDLGIDLRAQELGADRLRKIVDIIGELRRSKGTKGAIERELTAIAGSDVVVDTIDKSIFVYAQRCNLVKDPTFVNGVQAGLDGGVPTSNPTLTFDVGFPYTGWNKDDLEYNAYVGSAGGDLDALGYAVGTIFDGGSTPNPTVRDPIIGSQQKWISYPDPETGAFENLETLGADIFVRFGDILYFSVQQSSTLKNIQDAIVRVSLYTEGGLSEGSLIVSDSEPVEVNGILYWRLEVPEFIPDGLGGETSLEGYTRAVVSLVFLPVIGDLSFTYDDFSNILLERNYLGDYFDGDTRKGGWLVENMNSISDFRWRDPDNPNTSLPNTSFSVYSPNYQKTKNVIQRLLPDILPVPELITRGIAYSNRTVTSGLKYRIFYDVIPGFEPYDPPTVIGGGEGGGGGPGIIF